MAIEVFIGYPPSRESPQAEFCIRHDGFVDIPAVLYREDGELMIEIFSRRWGPRMDAVAFRLRGCY